MRATSGRFFRCNLILRLCGVLWCIAFGVSESNCQIVGLEEVGRYQGVAFRFPIPNLRANQYGVALALTSKRRGPDSMVYFPNTVIALTQRGVDTIDLGAGVPAQAVIWKDTVYASVSKVKDTLVKSVSLDDRGQSGIAVPYEAPMGHIINCVDGSLCFGDWKGEGINVRRSASDTLTSCGSARIELDVLEIFSITGDVYKLTQAETWHVPYGEKDGTRLSNNAGNRMNNRNNVSVIQDSVVWYDDDRTRWAVSLKDQGYTSTKFSGTTNVRAGGCAGQRGYFNLQPLGSGGLWFSNIEIGYTNGLDVHVVDTLIVPYTRLSANGVGWWNGAFYFTAEVRDTVTPEENTITILYKYTEPTPTVSVSDEVPNNSRDWVTDRLMFTNDAYQQWLSGLGSNVSVYDLLGNAIPSNEPLTGVVCVRESNKMWLVSVVE